MASATVDRKASPGVVLYRLSAGDYYRMVELDIIPHDRRVGLWDGLLFEKMVESCAHAVAKSKLIMTLAPALPDGWFGSVGNPVTINSGTVPLPALLVIRGEPDDYLDRPREAADVGLIVEIVDESVKEDEDDRLITYARASVPAYWIINLRADRVDAYSEPRVRRGVPSYKVSAPYASEDPISRARRPANRHGPRPRPVAEAAQALRQDTR